VTGGQRLSADQAKAILGRATPVPVNRGASPIPVVDITGTDLVGMSKSVNLIGAERSTLLLFLSASCHGCLDLFAASQEPSSLGVSTGTDLRIVLRSSDGRESSTLVGGAEAIVSDQAWDSYRVTGPPFFSFIVPGCLTVATEGVAWGAQSVCDAVNAALGGDYVVENPRLDGDD